MIDFDEIFHGQRVMAILRGYSPSESVEMAVRAWDLGIAVVEVPVPDRAAMLALEAVIGAGRERGRIAGAGTVTTLEQVSAVHQLGAAFTVAPGLDLKVAEASHAVEMPHLPGAATATELQCAIAGSLRWIKVFPAAALGARWLQLIREPFPQARLVATGGMSAGNAAQFLAAGADVVAVGSALRQSSQLLELGRLQHPDATEQTAQP
jgi:2-dehydro-3-deoxyphosphogluconate aldolase/(4S)-4-hydroxy-2-oxoglutarate aldolase